MGIHCEINLRKPPNGVFVGKAGSVVSGVIRYSLDEETVLTKITASLKGIGKMIYEARGTYLDEKETYVDTDYVIHQQYKDNIMPIGIYEAPFKFVIPHNLPHTLAYKTIKPKNMCSVRCNINYYVNIKFARKGAMKFDKQFVKEVTLVSGIIQRLPRTPTVYEDGKRLTQLFTHTTNSVNIRANIQNSVLKPGGKIEIHYEVTNQTNLTVKAVEVKVVEVYKFFIRNRLKIGQSESDVIGLESKNGAIQSEQTQDMSVVMKLPSDINSSEFSNLYSRDYFVFITIHLPFPHKNYVLQIPIQIGNIIAESNGEVSSFEEKALPTSYWELMNEHI